MTEPVYASPPMRIGKTDWRLLIRPGFGGGLANAYQWRDAAGGWRCQREHPRYNPHDGTYAGLPRGLRNLWQREAPALRRHGLHAPPMADPGYATSDGLRDGSISLGQAITLEQRRREVRRDCQPLPPGGLFDEVARNQRDLFS